MVQYRFYILATAWILWIAPLFRLARTKKPATVDRRARWGVLIQGVAYGVVWFGPYWRRPAEDWQVVVSTPLLMGGILLSWTATRFLGRQWRIEAGLNPDHELVRSGPYQFVRHPIYAAMLLMLLGTGFAITPLPRLAVALVIFIIGTEVRVRVEDALLASRFGETFQEYRRSVAAYLPFVR